MTTRKEKETGQSEEGQKLTIKLLDDVYNLLRPGPATLLADDYAFLLGPAQILPQDEIQGQSDTGENDGPAPDTPLPADIVVESFGGLGSRKRRNHRRRRCECKRQPSISEVGDVGGEYVPAVREPPKTDRVKDLFVFRSAHAYRPTRQWFIGPERQAILGEKDDRTNLSSTIC